MSMVKVIIFNSYGYNRLPEFITDQIDGKSFLDLRCGKIVELLEAYPVADPNELQERYNNLEKDQVLRSNKKFYFGAKPYNMSCSIQEVDTSRRWTITEYDGAESIKYLEPALKIKEINYWGE